uniref:Uncharacterized protein n=1 Tax=Ditylenchus dipsaci TaxID=166011 RepID=A0A915EQI5_9BILA
MSRTKKLLGFQNIEVQVLVAFLSLSVIKSRSRGGKEKVPKMYDVVVIAATANDDSASDQVCVQFQNNTHAFYKRDKLQKILRNSK